MPPTSLELATRKRAAEGDSYNGDGVVSALAKIVATRRILMKPSFQIFDKHNRGTGLEIVILFLNMFVSFAFFFTFIK